MYNKRKQGKLSSALPRSVSAREQNFDVASLPNLGKMAISSDKYLTKQQFPFMLKNFTNATPCALVKKTQWRSDYPSDFYDSNPQQLEMLKVANNFQDLLLSQIDYQQQSMRALLKKRSKQAYQVMLRAQSAGMERETKSYMTRFSQDAINYQRLVNSCDFKLQAVKHVSKSRLQYEERMDTAFRSTKPELSDSKDFFQLANALDPRKGSK